MGVWLNNSTSRPDLDLWLDVKNQQLYRVMSSEYVRVVSGMEYKIKNYDDKIKCEEKDRSYRRIKRHMIVGLDKYNIQYNFSSR